MPDLNSFYDRLSAERGGDSAELVACVENVVRKLEVNETGPQKPGMLLGKIQSGKTRGFLGIIAEGFGAGYDIAIVLTKGTKTLSNQTMARFRNDFGQFIEEDTVALFDVMQMPTKLTGSERNRKLIFVAKKQKDNLANLIKLFEEKYPDLCNKRVLLVDDEADAASVRFVKSKGKEALEQGRIADQMDAIRRLVPRLSFLQVTATPYALYLQPENYQGPGRDCLFLPKRPSFTELLPIHDAYVGGADYFGEFDADNPRFYLHLEVPEEEQETLRSLDGRSVRQDRVFSNTKIAVFRLSIVSFITAVIVRRRQQAFAAEKLTKYAMVIHNDVQKAAHKFQGELATTLLKAFTEDAEQGGANLRPLFDAAYLDLSLSVEADGGLMPDCESTFSELCETLSGDEIVISEVNSDNDVAALLNSDAELHLRTPYNIFIGGNILDRGITIPNLISFYYGRNPKRMQADTVLQHSRMYGARKPKDLAVTRFYTSRGVYDRLESIEKFEVALRHAFESGAHERGVAFIQKDDSNQIIPCAPNKVLMSSTISLGPGRRLLPIGFEMRAKTHIRPLIDSIDRLVPESCTNTDQPLLCSLSLAHKILGLIEKSMEVNGSQWDWGGISAVIDYYASITRVPDHSQKIWLSAYTGRKLERTREGGRFNNSPDTKQQRDLSKAYARDIPMLLLFQQEGLKSQGWSDTRFWWPVLIAPHEAAACIYAAEIADDDPP